MLDAQADQKQERKFLTALAADANVFATIQRFMQESANNIVISSSPVVSRTAEHIGWYIQPLSRLEVVEEVLRQWCGRNSVDYAGLLQRLSTHKVGVSRYSVTLDDINERVKCVLFDFSPRDACEPQEITHARLLLEHYVRNSLFLRYNKLGILSSFGIAPTIDIYAVESIVKIYDFKVELVIQNKLLKPMHAIMKKRKVLFSTTRIRFPPTAVAAKYGVVHTRQLRVAVIPLATACNAFNSEIYKHLDSIVKFEPVERTKDVAES